MTSGAQVHGNQCVEGSQRTSSPTCSCHCCPCTLPWFSTHVVPQCCCAHGGLHRKAQVPFLADRCNTSCASDLCYRLDAEKLEGRHYGQASCRDYRESLLHVLPHSWSGPQVGGWETSPGGLHLCYVYHTCCIIHLRTCMCCVTRMCNLYVVLFIVVG
jgi:hypothetical protein